MSTIGIYRKLLNIQTELKAPKGQYNSFGKYKYRSCEDILESVKPICRSHNATLIVSDELQNIGERYYIKATATIIDIEDGSCLSNTAYAREEETKKGMDGSQITGTASSYARKYALNGLFCIDDTKDADTNEYKQQLEKTEKIMTINKTMEDALREIIKKKQISTQTVLSILADYGYNKLSEIEIGDLKIIQEALEKDEEEA